MSHQHLTHDHDDVPRFEAWFGIMVSSLVPVVIALFVPHSFAIPLITLTVLLFIAGLVVLSVQSRRRARERRLVERSGRRPDSPGTSQLTVEAE